jgi:hypothetical protein
MFSRLGSFGPALPLVLLAAPGRFLDVGISRLG